MITLIKSSKLDQKDVYPEFMTIIKLGNVGDATQKTPILDIGIIPYDELRVGCIKDFKDNKKDLKKFLKTSSVRAGLSLLYTAMDKKDTLFVLTCSDEEYESGYPTEIRKLIEKDTGVEFTSPKDFFKNVDSIVKDCRKVVKKAKKSKKEKVASKFIKEKVEELYEEKTIFTMGGSDKLAKMQREFRIDTLVGALKKEKMIVIDDSRVFVNDKYDFKKNKKSEIKVEEMVEMISDTYENSPKNIQKIITKLVDKTLGVDKFKTSKINKVLLAESDSVQKAINFAIAVFAAIEEARDTELQEI